MNTTERKRFARARGFTGSSLARAIGTQNSATSDLLRGTRHTRHLQDAVAAALGIEAQVFFGADLGPPEAYVPGPRPHGLPNRVNEAFMEAGLSQVSAARILGTTKTALNKVVRSRAKTPWVQEAVARLLWRNAAELWGAEYWMRVSRQYPPAKRGVGVTWDLTQGGAA